MNTNPPRISLEGSNESYKVELDGRWTLQDFGSFSQVFTQAYSILLAIEEGETFIDEDRLSHAFTGHAWRGAGFSAANFYREVRQSIPKEIRPTIESIQYSSPGCMELALWVGTAYSLSLLVKHTVKTFEYITDYYNKLYKQLYERKLTKIDSREKELQLIQRESEFLEEQLNSFAHAMGFTEVDKLRELCGNDLRALKILLGLFRYVKELAKNEQSGKAKLPTPTSDEEPSGDDNANGK